MYSSLTMLLHFGALSCEALVYCFSSRDLPLLQPLRHGCQHQVWLDWQWKLGQLFVNALPVFLTSFPHLLSFVPPGRNNRTVRNISD